MATWMKNVYSTMIREVGYDGDAKEMIVAFKNGKRAAYAGVTEEQAMQLANAPSAGSLFHAEFRNLPFRYI